MNFLRKKRRQSAAKRRQALALNLDKIPVFKGFSHTVEEGERLARRSYTELPEFKKPE